MLFEVPSRSSLSDIDRKLRESAARHKFGVIAALDLREKMKEKGVEYDGECIIYEVCNPVQAKKVLEANPAVSTALPCRISVYRSGDSYRIATILPTEMIRAFGSPELQPVAEEVESVIKAMMQESA